MSGIIIEEWVSPVYQDTLSANSTTGIDYTVPTDTVVFVQAFAILYLNSGGATVGGGLIAEGWFCNSAGTVTAITALAGSTNPRDSTSLSTLRAEALNAQFVGSGPGASTLVLSASTNKVVATLAYHTDTATTVEVNIYLKILSQTTNGV